MYVGIQTDRRISDVDDGGIVIWLRDSGVVGTGRYRRHEALHTQPLSLSLVLSLTPLVSFSFSLSRSSSLSNLFQSLFFPWGDHCTALLSSRCC